MQLGTRLTHTTNIPTACLSMLPLPLMMVDTRMDLVVILAMDLKGTNHHLQALSNLVSESLLLTRLCREASSTKLDFWQRRKPLYIKNTLVQGKDGSVGVTLPKDCTGESSWKQPRFIIRNLHLCFLLFPQILFLSLRVFFSAVGDYSMQWEYRVPGNPDCDICGTVYPFAFQNFTILTSFDDAPRVVEAESDLDSSLSSRGEHNVQWKKERNKQTKRKSPPLLGFERMGWLWVDLSSIGISLIPVHFLLYRWTDFNSFQDHPWRTNSSLTAHDYVLNKQQHPPLPVYLLYMWTGFRSLMPYFSMMIDWYLWGKAATLWLQRARFTRGEKDWRKSYDTDTKRHRFGASLSKASTFPRTSCSAED